ncbi:hypothetical protein RD055328_13050 [Companilactobacillus sp. RD055328]|uniref:GNAT family N-acetyltransferase n=1 Tax=Companilactobacillus sp. RD055328 TaxID=2916634 RepID=UPI001FC87CFA|nr:GNAT family N-acetyltransferase [Companilactobacillus sp. RD055328]GKQ43382.1 hypothetical protein RD055328_13050 [Companilactobacillus sp. RD055328]
MRVRPSTINDHKQMTQVLIEAFFEYPVFIAFLPDKEHRQDFLSELFTANIKVFEKINGSYVAEADDGSIQGVILVKDDKHKEPGVMSYLINSKKGMFKPSNIRSLIDFFRIIEEMDGEFISQDISWYVDSLAIKPSSQGKGIGSLLLDELDQIVKKRKGGRIVLSTNTATNAKFYEKNGYQLVNHSTKNTKFETWHFAKEI